MYPEKSFDAGEVVLNYAERETAGPPMVLLHGLSSWWHRYEPIIPRLPGWHIYACDLRGHGKSGRVAGRYHVPDYARDIVAFLREVVVEPAVLIGFSLGGLTSLATAAQAPVRALILVDPPLYLRNLSIQGTPGVYEWFKWVSTTAPLPYEEVVERCKIMSPEAGNDEIRALADNISSVSADTANITLQDRLIEGFDIEQALRQVKCPTFLLRGEWSLGAAVRDEDEALVQASIPHVVSVQIANGGHTFLFEQPDATLPYIERFLQSL
jgi:pimeloyl-ACP methyl ester carboxylesterase